MVKVYSTTNCKYCKLAKLFLQSNGVDFDYINIDNGEVEKYCCGTVQSEVNNSAQAEFDSYEAMGAPLIIVDGEVFMGFNPEIQVKIAEKLGL